MWCVIDEQVMITGSGSRWVTTSAEQYSGENFVNNSDCDATCSYWFHVTVHRLTVLKTDAVILVEGFREMFAFFFVVLRTALLNSACPYHLLLRDKTWCAAGSVCVHTDVCAHLKCHNLHLKTH